MDCYTSLFSYPSSTNTDDLPIDTVQSYHSRERELYSHMTLGLGLDATRSMELIAFWLWLQERNPRDVITTINSIDDASLHSISATGGILLDALRIDTPLDLCTLGFHQQAVHGVKFYLRSVCLIALADLRVEAEEAAATARRIDELVEQMNRAFLDVGRVVASPHVSHGEGTSRGDVSRRRGYNLSVGDVERVILGGYPLKGLATPSTATSRATQLVTNPNPNPNLFTIPIPIPNPVPIRNPIPVGVGYGLVPVFPQMRGPIIREDVPIEERTLFVTFSNGYPLTEDELHGFFMRYSSDVEIVNIQKTRDGKPPQFAHVSFYNLETIYRVLNGHEKVKFITNGKHLWARRFIPKRNH